MIGTVLLLGALLGPTGAGAQRVSDPQRLQEAVERGLLPEVTAAGEALPSWTIAERMKRYGVPGVSIAVIDEGRIAWARGYGVRRAGSGDSITTATLFQAASLSKPVAAAAALRLVRERKVSLDENVNERLRSWRVPSSRHTERQAVTLRGLLSHSGGIGVQGFPGYARGMQTPTLQQILDGTGPANSPPIRVDYTPGTRTRYSGGGYVIVQQLIEDVTERPFAQAMRDLVLTPARMSSSTFEQPLPDVLAPQAAVAHGWDGQPIDGDWHTYPEQAAAGLWTTPTDLARFALAIQRAATGVDSSILDQATARAMLTEVRGGAGLGVGLAGEARDRRFTHSGSNRGFRSYMVMYPERGDGVVVMTNGDEGMNLTMEIVRAVARVYQWPDYAPTVREVARLSPAQLDRYVGIYRTRGSQRAFVITRRGNRLHLETPRGSRYTFLPTSERRFVAIEDGSTMAFDEEDGRLELRVFGLRARRSPQQ